MLGRVPGELRDIDLALASFAEAEWPALAGPVLLGRLETRVGIDDGERVGAVRRAQYLAAAHGDPHDGDDPDGPAVAFLADELESRERRSALADAVRADLARAVAQRLPRVEAVLRQLAAPPGDDPALTWRLFCSALYVLAMDDEAV
jgi:hypothetical protein